MAVTRQPSLRHDLAIVDSLGRPTPEFQRAWQGLSATAAVGGAAPDTYVRKGQITGWASPTGTVSRLTFATYAAPAISNPPTQAEVQMLANQVQVLSQRLAAALNDLKTLQAFNS